LKKIKKQGLGGNLAGAVSRGVERAGTLREGVLAKHMSPFPGGRGMEAKRRLSNCVETFGVLLVGPNDKRLYCKVKGKLTAGGGVRQENKEMNFCGGEGFGTGKRDQQRTRRKEEKEWGFQGP